ncbi:MAG: PorV/PorQ family protein [Sediminibacterium sp.]
MKKLFTFFLFCCGAAKAQSPEPVVTAFSSLRIPASSRGLSMGDAGIASAVENQSLYYNASKTAFTQNFHQVSVSYTPWLTAVSKDTRFIALHYLGNISNTSAIGVGINYLNLGSIETRDNNGATIAAYHSREFNIGLSYALQFGSNASLGLAFKFLGQNIFSDVPKNIYSVCGDISYYQFADLGDAGGRIEWGAVVSNLGPKVNVPGMQAKTPLPFTLGLGIGYKMAEGEGDNSFSVCADLNKLLVPEIIGELRDIRISTGIEYGYVGEFFLRGGVSLENQLRGNRKFFSLGIGYKGFVLDQSWGIDFHYIVPFGTLAAVSPFQNSCGFTLKMNLGNFQ